MLETGLQVERNHFANENSFRRQPPSARTTEWPPFYAASPLQRDQGDDAVSHEGYKK